MRFFRSNESNGPANSSIPEDKCFLVVQATRELIISNYFTGKKDSFFRDFKVGYLYDTEEHAMNSVNSAGENKYFIIALSGEPSTVRQLADEGSLHTAMLYAVDLGKLKLASMYPNHFPTRITPKKSNSKCLIDSEGRIPSPELEIK